MADRAGRIRPYEDVVLSAGFFTRLPVPALADPPAFSDAIWAAPLVGVAIGLATGAVCVAASALGLPAGVAAALALAVGMLATGALHEDGLADLADGFGGGRDRETKLAIMRDSRIGTYGVLALGLSLLLRWAAVAALAEGPALAVVGACVASHAASRAVLPAFLRFVPPARPDGLGAGVGVVAQRTALLAGAIGLAALLLLGIGASILGALLLVLSCVALARLCRAQIGGQTGDVLGALQQSGEALILVLAASSTGIPA